MNCGGIAMTLDSLVENGLISKQFMIYPEKDFDSMGISEFLKLSERDQCLYTGIITADNPVWIATVMKKNPMNASVIYSSDGTTLSSWNSNKRTFSKLKVTDNGLVVQSRKSFYKEETKMSSLDELMKGANVAAPAGPVEQSTAFDGEAKKTKEESASKKFAADIMSKSDGNLNNDALVHFNRTHGRLQGYIVDHNESIRVAKTKQPTKDGNGKPILKPGASEDSVRKYKEGKNFSNADKVMENLITFRQAKPGPIKCVVYTQPAGGQVALSYILSGKGDEMVDLKNTTLKKMIAPLEAFYAIIQSQFGGVIQEDQAILGDKASKVIANSHVTVSKKADTDGKEVGKVRTTLKLESGKDSARKSLLFPGNYFPMNVFDTISTQNLSEEDAKILNINIEATIKTKENYDELNANSKAAIQFDESVTLNEERGAVTSDFFKKGGGTPIEVAAYYDKNTKLSSISVPKRIKVKSKDGTKCVYKFVRIKAGEAGGPQEIKDYTDFVTKAGYSVDEFINLANDKIASSKGTSRSGSKNTISPEAYLRQRFAEQKNTSIQSIDKNLKVADIDSLFGA